MVKYTGYRWPGMIHLFLFVRIWTANTDLDMTITVLEGTKSLWIIFDIIAGNFCCFGLGSHSDNHGQEYPQ